MSYLQTSLSRQKMGSMHSSPPPLNKTHNYQSKAQRWMQARCPGSCGRRLRGTRKSLFAIERKMKRKKASPLQSCLSSEAVHCDVALQ